MANDRLVALPRQRRLSHAEHDDGITVIGHIGGWIGNADTKGALLAGGVAIVTTTVLDHPALQVAIDADPPGRFIAIALFAAIVASLGFTVVCLGLTLFPRTHPPNGGPNRYAFPHRASAPEILPQGDDREEEGWQQVKTLAIIANTKFRWLRRAFVGFAVSLALTVGWTVTAAIVAGSPSPGY